MEDEKIVGLYNERDERAVSETKTKYFHYLFKISMNVLGDAGDAEECVNDTYLKAWQNIPPDRPRSLSAYLAVIVRRVSLDRLKKRAAGKRCGAEYDLSLDELGECVPAGGSSVEDEVERTELGATVSRYLLSLSETERVVFTGRYFYLDSVRAIASYTGLTPAKVRGMLEKLREGLRGRLEEEGYGAKEGIQNEKRRIDGSGRRHR